MLNHPHAELVRRGYELFSRGDLESLAELFHPATVWHVPGEGPFSGDHVGREAVFAVFREMLQATDGTFNAQVRDVVAHGEHAVAITRLTAEFQGKRLDADGAAVYHIRDGAIREMWSLRPSVRSGGELLSSEASAAAPA